MDELRSQLDGRGKAGFMHGVNPSAEALPCLEEENVQARAGKFSYRGESSRTSTDDDDITSRHGDRRSRGGAMSVSDLFDACPTLELFAAARGFIRSGRVVSAQSACGYFSHRFDTFCAEHAALWNEAGVFQR